MLNLKDFAKKLTDGDFKHLFSEHADGNSSIHPSDLANIFATLNEKQSREVFASFNREQQAVIFPYLDYGAQRRIILNLPAHNAEYILNSLKSDDRAIFFSNSRGADTGRFLSLLNDKNRAEITGVLGYSGKSIASLINTEVAKINQDMSVGQAAQFLRQNFPADSEAANVIYIVDENGKLVDDVPIRKLVLNPPDTKISDIQDGFCVKLRMDDTKTEAVRKFKNYDRTVLPVVNGEDILTGVITVDDVMDVQEQADTAEIQKFGGIEELDYPYVHTSFFQLLRKRAGWLIILFLSEMLTATAMGRFSDEISKAVVLALFVPLVMSSGGNSGSQAATLIIRAMALKEITLKDWFWVMRRELLSGLCLGIILGAIGFLRISLWQKLGWYDYGPHWQLIGVTIFCSLIGIILWGTISGSMVPMLLRRFKFDPATSSAPFIATLVDVTGLVIYFSIAAVFLKGTLL